MSIRSRLDRLEEQLGRAAQAEQDDAWLDVPLLAPSDVTRPVCRLLGRRSLFDARDDEAIADAERRSAELREREPQQYAGHTALDVLVADLTAFIRADPLRAERVARHLTGVAVWGGEAGLRVRGALAPLLDAEDIALLEQEPVRRSA